MAGTAGPGIMAGAAAAMFVQSFVNGSKLGMRLCKSAKFKLSYLSWWLWKNKMALHFII